MSTDRGSALDKHRHADFGGSNMLAAFSRLTRARSNPAAGNAASRTARSRLRLAAVLLAVASPVVPAVSVLTIETAHAASCDAVLVSGSAWLGGEGVDVRSNGANTGTANSCRGYVQNLSQNPPQWGYGWQCPELVNRLFMTRGWITSTWSGNGYQMYGTAPAHLAKAPQGSIDYIAAGDVVVFNTKFFSGFGHVGVVASFDGTNGVLFSQNTNNHAWSFTLNSGSISFPGIATPDKITGVVHRPGGGAPSDQAAPSVPTALTPHTHLGRTNLQWTASTDNVGVATYFIYRDGILVGSSATPSWVDRSVSPRQMHSYQVSAADAAGNQSARSIARVVVGREHQADRTWVSTVAGPALCGRTGDAVNRRLGCTVLTADGWRLRQLPRVTDWGYSDARAFVPTPDGNVAYCRTAGSAEDQRVTCTKFNGKTLAWGSDRVSGRTDWTYPDTF